MTLQELVAHFESPKKNGDCSYQCKCPAHADRKASLTISEKRGKLLLHCHAGCKAEDVLQSVGLSFADLNDRKPPEWKERLEYGQKKRIEAVYDYKAADGKYLYSKVRFEGKTIRYITIDRANDEYQYCKVKGIATLYRLPGLVKAIRNEYPVYIVEGEKDVETLRDIGYTATTAGGVNDWRKEYASYFTGAKVVILPDNDRPGLELKDRIMRDLKPFAHSIRWTITSEADKGDVTDYLQKEGHSKDDLKQLIAASDNIAAPWVYLTGRGEKQTPRINAGILADNISRGLRYLVVRRPGEEKDDFYLYENGVYNKCNRNKAKSVILRYIPMSLASDNLLNNVYNMLLCQERNICTFKDLDADEKHINLRNGLYNLETRQLEAHNPNVYSTRQLLCEYHPEDGSRPTFNRYIDDLCRDSSGEVDRQKQAILQEFGGLLLSNVNGYRIKGCLVLWSPLGNTGKTQFINLITALLGDDQAANVPIQNMNEESKFALGNIVGKRLISIGDQTSSEIKDSSIFKQLTGGDEIKCESKGKQPFNYRYPGGIIIACNNLPTFKDDKGGHLFERLCIIPCTNTIEPERRDSFILDKMLKEEPAILNWFLEGLHRLIDNGFKLTRSESCNAAMNEYREKMDTVYRYLSENYIITGKKEDMVSKPQFENDYLRWCEENGCRNVNKQNIKDRMEANGCPVIKARYQGKVGVMVYRGLRELGTEFRNITEEEYMQQEFPFA